MNSTHFVVFGKVPRLGLIYLLLPLLTVLFCDAEIEVIVVECEIVHGIVELCCASPHAVLWTQLLRASPAAVFGGLLADFLASSRISEFRKTVTVIGAADTNVCFVMRRIVQRRVAVRDMVHWCASAFVVSEG